jgi:hypothetical protein
MEKRVNVRVEHIKHSKCRQEFLDRVKSNAAKKVEAAKTGEKVVLKRKPVQPREARHISLKNNVPQTLTVLPCELTGFDELDVTDDIRRDYHLSRKDCSLGFVRCEDAFIHSGLLSGPVLLGSREPHGD